MSWQVADTHPTMSLNIDEKEYLIDRPKEKQTSSRLYQILCFTCNYAPKAVYLIRYALREITKRKLNYTLGCLSCFVVVWMVSLALTALNQVPLIFYRLAEVKNGEFDVRLSLATNQVPGITINTTIANQFPNEMRFYSMRNEHHITVFTSIDKCSWSQDGNKTQEFYRKELQNVPQQYPSWMWMYHGEYENSTCREASNSCVPTFCPKSVSNILFALIDTAREKEMGFGSKWDFPIAPPGHAYMSASMASVNQISIGDVVIVEVPTNPTYIGPFRQSEIVTDDPMKPWTNVAFKSVMYMPVIIDGMFDEYSNGKFPAGSNTIVMEYESFLTHFAYFVPPVFSEEYRKKLSTVDLRHYANFLYVNHPPSRLDVYRENDYDIVQAKITKFASNIKYLLGFVFLFLLNKNRFDQLSASFPMLEDLRLTQFFALFLGLLITFVVTVLAAISVLLIYSLLMINVESRTFEIVC